MMTILLRDRNPDIVAAWQRAFAGEADVQVSRGDILELTADAIISPANSFGFMDGGIDAAYTLFFGNRLQVTLKNKIRDAWHGELPVGQAELVVTGHPSIPFLVSCPTMRVPEDVSGTVNAYLAFRAALIRVQEWNRSAPRQITSLLCPGLGTHTGRIAPGACAQQMKAAYDHVVKGKNPAYATLHEAMADHEGMKTPISKGAQIMPGSENRKEERFSAELLPENLKYVRVLFDGSEMIATVIDASLSGFGFQIFVPIEKVVLGTTLPIYPLATKKAIYGTIVYAQALDAANSRVGVQLKEVGQYLEYRKELEQIIELVAGPKDIY